MRYKSKLWNPKRDAILREYCRDIAAAQIALMVGLSEIRVINRLAELGLRKRVFSHTYVPHPKARASR